MDNKSAGSFRPTNNGLFGRFNLVSITKKLDV